MESVGQVVTPDTSTVLDRPALAGTAAGRNLHRMGRNALLAFTDAAMIFMSTALAYIFWAEPVRQQPAGIYLELAPLILLFLAGYSRAGLYPSLGLGPVQTLRRLSYVTMFGFLVVAAFSFAFKLPHVYSRGAFLLACILSLGLVPLGRLALFSLARRWQWWAEPVVIIGTGPRAVRTIRGIKRSGHLGYSPVAVLSFGAAPRVRDTLEGVPVLGGLDQIGALSACGVRVAFLEVEQTPTRLIVDRLQQVFRQVVLIHEFDDLPVEGLQVRNLGNLVGIEYSNNLLRPEKQTVKRVLDLALVAVGVAFVAPLILLAALAVLLIDGGPVFFYQDRTGKAGQLIKVPKIRTMRRDAEKRLEDCLNADPALREEWLRNHKLRDDPRLIPGVGQLFRRYSVDELPQVWSVIVGDMSIVGPRPFPDYHLARFTPAFLELRQRVRPGITGLWQVTVRSEGGIEEQEAYDSYYIRNWSIWFDLYILGRTIVAVASGRGAY
jgi:Undecaprenyl-phosphate galactose phosphotransferase WbaP